MPNVASSIDTKMGNPSEYQLQDVSKGGYIKGGQDESIRCSNDSWAKNQSKPMGSIPGGQK